MSGIMSGGGGAPAHREPLPGFNQHEFESSFREFCSRPENKGMVQKTQKAEVKKVQQAEEQMRALKFRDVVLAAEPQAQKAVAPFLQVPILRRVVQTMANDERGDFTAWATNPLVLEYLGLAKKALDEGLMTEAEAEHLMLAQIKDPKWNPDAEGFKARTRPKARLDTAQLVGALNEQLQERNAGNMAYRAKRFDQAMECYERALSILNIVEGVSTADQAEVDTNKVAVLWNMAAAHMARCEFGAAAARCGDALQLEPDSIRVLLRRAKALTQRGEYALAEADLARVKDLEPWSYEAEDALAELRAQRKQHSKGDVAFAAAAMAARGTK